MLWLKKWKLHESTQGVWEEGEKPPVLQPASWLDQQPLHVRGYHPRGATSHLESGKQVLAFLKTATSLNVANSLNLRAMLATSLVYFSY
jgi:hypothetical protein